MERESYYKHSKLCCILKGVCMGSFVSIQRSILNNSKDVKFLEEVTFKLSLEGCGGIVTRRRGKEFQNKIRA